MNFSLLLFLLPFLHASSSTIVQEEEVTTIQECFYNTIINNQQVIRKALPYKYSTSILTKILSQVGGHPINGGDFRDTNNEFLGWRKRFIREEEFGGSVKVWKNESQFFLQTQKETFSRKHVFAIIPSTDNECNLEKGCPKEQLYYLGLAPLDDQDNFMNKIFMPSY